MLSGVLPAKFMKLYDLALEITELIPVAARGLYNRASSGRADFPAIMSSSVHRLLRFGMYEMNLDTQELSNAGTLVKLAPQPFKLLEMLASNAGQIVSREDIQKQIWGDDTFVDFERGVHKCINQIRSVLNDKSDRPLYIETVPRKGYRFLAPVTSKNIVAVPQVRQSGPLDPETIEQYTKPPFGGQDREISGPQESIAVSAAPGAGGSVAASGPSAVAAQPATGAEKPKVSPAPVALIRGPIAWVIGLALALAVIGGAILYFRPPGPPQSAGNALENTVVLADFANLTGDDVFDGTLKQALAIQLEQSPYLTLVSERKTLNILRNMNLAEDQRLTLSVALDVCLRANAKAVLVGSIKPEGERYRLSLTALNCRTGESITSAQATAANKQRVLRTVEQIGNDFRKHLGESLPSIKEFDRPLEDATTGSLEALQAFSQGRKAQLSRSEDPTPYFKKAIEIDPAFAYCYASLAIYYSNLGETTLARKYFTDAFNLRSRVNQRERYYIEAHYYEGVTGELEEAIRIYTAWSQAYPGDFIPHNNLNPIYNAIGQYERAVSEAQRAIPLNEENVNAYLGLTNSYNYLYRMNEVRDVYQQAKDKHLRLIPFSAPLYTAAFLSGDQAGMDLSWNSAKGNAGYEDLLLALQADTEAYHGRIQNSRSLSNQAVMSARKSQDMETAAMWRATESLREAEVGNSDRAKTQVADALKMSDSITIRSIASMTLARLGEVGDARSMAAQLSSDAPRATITQFYLLPSLRAAIDIATNNPASAVKSLAVATPYQDGNSVISNANMGNLYPVFLRGIAYSNSGMPQAAAREFQYIIDHPGITTNSIVGPLAHLYLARALALAGESQEAKKRYEEFLALWNGADSDVPIYKLAKAEYAKVK